MKTHRLFLILPLVALLALGATTIKWFTDTTLTTSPTDSMVVELQSTGPNAYYYTPLLNLKSYIVNGITNLTINGITVTNGITNFNLTANTVVKADASRALASIPNGTGALTNNNAGAFGWYPDYASFTDLNNASNAIITQITNLSAIVSNISALDTLTVTNGFTNLSLTAKTQVQTDENKRLVSTPNGTGALTNNNSGDFGWFNEFASKSEVTNLVNGASNFTTLTVTNTATVNQLDYYTNAVATCDFSKGYGWTNVSAGFTFPAPINLPSPLNKAPTCVVLVTNSSGTAIQIVEPANCHVVPNSVMWVTNVTSFTFFLYGNAMTNVYGIPLF